MRDRIRNAHIKKELELEPVTNIERKALRWFGNVVRIGERRIEECDRMGRLHGTNHDKEKSL